MKKQRGFRKGRWNTDCKEGGAPSSNGRKNATFKKGRDLTKKKFYATSQDRGREGEPKNKGSLPL